MSHTNNPETINSAPSQVEAGNGQSPVQDGDNGDSVLGMIASVEAQLNRIREVQQEQADQLTTLEERWLLLEEAERAMRLRQEQIAGEENRLEQAASDLAKQSDALGQRQRELVNEKDAIETSRGEVSQAEHALRKREAAHSASQAKIAQAQALLDQHWNDLRAERERVNAEAERLSEREAALNSETASVRAATEAAVKEREEAQRTVAALRESAHGAARELEATRRELETTKRELSGALSRVKEAAAERDDLKSRVEHAEANVGELIERLEKVQNEVEQERASAVDARRRVASLENELVTTRQRVEASETEALALVEQAESDAKARIEAARREIESRDVELAQVKRDLAVKERMVASQEATLVAAKQKLAEFARSIGEQTQQIQRGAEAIAAVRDLKQQVSRLKDQLAEAKLAADPIEIVRREERIKELTEALRQARGQTLSDDDVQKRDQRIEEQQTEITQLRAALERANVEAAEAQRAADAARSEGAPGREQEIITLTATVRELEARLAAAETRSSGPLKNDQSSQEMREKAAMLRQAAEHLRRRRARLARTRELLRARSRDGRRTGIVELGRESVESDRHADAEERMQQAARLERERESLAEAARALAASEKAMIRRWARPRAISVTGWLFVLAAVIAAGSWLAADHFFPAIRSASVTIEAEARPGMPLTDEQTAQWQAWHTGQLSDNTFLKTAAKRFADRRMPALADADRLKVALAENLTIDSTQDGQITMTMSGSDETELLASLDGLAVTLASEARRQSGRRTDGARTEIVGERQENGVTRYAAINPVAVEDRRVERAAFIFGGAFGAALLISGLVYVRLSRAKRVFDETD